MKNRFIVAQRTFTYNVEEIIKSIREINNDQSLEISDEEIWDLVSEWVYEDMRSPMSRHDLKWLDEDGNDLD